MIVKLIQNLIRFLFLVAIQVVVLNHIQWSGYVNPYVYILFLLLLPVETPKALQLVLGLVTGLVIDMFGNTSGLHAAASVFLMFARPGILRLIAPRDGYDAEVRLIPQVMGLNWFLTYAGILTFLHHLLYFYLEVFRFTEFGMTFLKLVINSAVSLLLIVMGTYLFIRSGKSNERILG